jgi:hypothetical protein
VFCCLIEATLVSEGQTVLADFAQETEEYQ